MYTNRKKLLPGLHPRLRQSCSIRVEVPVQGHASRYFLVPVRAPRLQQQRVGRRVPLRTERVKIEGSSTKRPLHKGPKVTVRQARQRDSRTPRSAEPPSRPEAASTRGRPRANSTRADTRSRQSYRDKPVWARAAGGWATSAPSSCRSASSGRRPRAAPASASWPQIACGSAAAPVWKSNFRPHAAMVSP